MDARMDNTEQVCPVCTLFLRPGITLKQHLTSHPKQKVIDALVKVSLQEELQKKQHSQPQFNQSISQGLPQNQPPAAPMPPYHNQVALGHPSHMGGHPSHMGGHMGPSPGNHFFMYQQSMSTSSPHQSNASPMPLNPFAQQYLVPTVYNAQMMPYFYHQQQQLIMSSNGIPPPVRALPFQTPGPNETVVSRLLDVPEEAIKEKTPEKEEEVEKEAEEPEPPQEDEASSESHSDACPEEDLDEEVQLVQEDDPLSIDGHDRETDTTSYKDEEEQKTDASYIHNENSSDHDYQSHILHDNDVEYEAQQIVDHEECIGTPLSHSSNSEWTFHSDLNKACQTQTSSNLSPRLSHQNEDPVVMSESTPDYFFVDQRSNMSAVYTSDNVRTSFEQSEPIYTSANILSNNEGVEFMSMEDIEGMQVIIGDFSGSPLIPQVDNYDTMRQGSPPILMTIGGMNVVSPRSIQNDSSMHILEPKGHEQHEDSCMENVNIRSDEKMPPRGELSGQESMGSASDITWNQIQHYQDQGNPMCFEHNSWDSSNEMPSYVEEHDKKEISTVDVSAFKEDEDSKETIVKPPLEKCKRPKPISLDVNRRKPKKLVIKPKRQKKETHSTFDNVFTNKLKIENAEIDDPDDMGLEPTAETDNKDDIKPEPRAPVLNMCKDCNEVFKTKKDLKVHNNEFHRREKVRLTKCQICNESFDIEHKFNEHLKIHPLECRMCGKLFYRRQGLKLHTARHLGIKPFKCELCDKAFLVKQKLEEHRNCHTGNSPIKCTMCDETFKRHSNLVQHRNRHHFMIKRKIKDYICSCGDVFHSKKKLAWHKEIHDQKPKACTQCSEKFIHKASLTRHMRRAHNAEYLPDNRNPTMANTICPICKGIYLKTSLEAHLKTHTTQKQFTCPICNKEFTTKWNLKLHKWTHASRTQKPFKCEMCRGAFIRENDYISHMNSHKSVRPYTCNYCGAQFIRKYNCQRHVKEHENDKTYNCNVCGKSFHRSYYLKDHMRVHSGIRPHSCHICGKTSTTKSNHNKHVQIHHAREPVSTEN